MRTGIATPRHPVLCALVAAAALLALPGALPAEDLGPSVGSAAERRGDLATLRDEWWQALERDPDSELAHAILARWTSALALAPGRGPQAGEWRSLAERTKNGWNRRRALRLAHAAARSAGTPWSAEELGLAAGTPREWLVIGPFGRRAESELYAERPAAADFDPEREEEGTFGPVRWQPLRRGPQDLYLDPGRSSWRRGPGWILRSRFSIAAGTEGFIEVATTGSLRVLIDGIEALAIDRARDHLPEVVRAPISADAGEHTVVIRSDGAPFLPRFVAADGTPWELGAISARETGRDAAWRPVPALVAVGLPDLAAAPLSAADRAARLLLAAENDDLSAIDRLLPTAAPGDEGAAADEGAPALAIAAERAIRMLGWLPDELERSRLEDFRRAALEADPELVPIAIARARTSADEDRVDDAMRELDGILERAPRSLEAWLLRESIARDHEWRRERTEALEALAEIDGDHPALLRRLRAAAQEDGRGDKVLELIAREFAREPTLGTGSSLVRSLARAGRADEATAIADRLEHLDPGSFELLRLRFSIAQSRRDVAELAALARRWTEEHRPGDPEPLDRLSDLHLELGDPGNALAALEEAALREPGRSDRARRIVHLRAGGPSPGSEPAEPWESELVPLEPVLADAPPPGSYPGANAVLLLDHMVSMATSDAGIVELTQQVIRLESQEAVEAYSTLPTSGEVRELAVHTPDGRVLEPTAGDDSGGYTLPGLEPGALIVLCTVRRQDLTDPEDLRLGPFYFRDPDFAVAFHRSEWIVEIPAEWPVEVVRRGDAPAPTETTRDGTRRIAWRIDRSGRPEPEPLSPPPDRILPNVEVRAELEWETVLPQLAANALRDDLPTPTLEAAAAEILAGVPAGAERVRALHAAVCERIPDEGGGGSATEVWLARAGDRDLALAGLLRAAGIPFRRVLAAPSPERIPWIDWSEPREAAFQAMLLEVEDDSGKPIWVHIPSRLAPFGRLPPEIRRGRAIRLDRTGGEWFDIPDGDPSLDAQALTGTITLEGDAPSAHLEGALEIRALPGSRLKEQLKDMPAFLRSTMLERFVQQTLPGAKLRSGEFRHYDERDPPLAIAFDLDAPSLVQVREGSPSLASTLLPSTLRRTFVRASTRNWPVHSPFENTVEEKLTIRLGSRFRARSLPEDLDLEGPWGRFRISTRSSDTGSGEDLVIDRLLELRPFHIGAERWPEFVEFCRQVDLREEARIPLEVASP